MPMPRFIRPAALSCCVVLLAGCATFRSADNELDAASRQLATGNIELTAEDAGAAKAEITPAGDLLVAGKPVALTPQQRSEVLSYRAEYVAIAQQGIAIGKQGIAVGRRSVAPVLFAALFGESDDRIEAHMDERMAGIRKATAALCDQLPGLMAAQQRLDADVPAFRPYATLTQRKIDECRKDALKDGDD